MSRERKLSPHQRDTAPRTRGYAAGQLQRKADSVIVKLFQTCDEHVVVVSGLIDQGKMLREIRDGEAQPELGQQRSRPRQCLLRVAAAENDEFVAIGDDVGTECFTPSAETLMLREPIHVDDGEQRAGDTPLRRARLVALTAAHAPFPVAISLLDWCLQP